MIVDVIVLVIIGYSLVNGIRQGLILSFASFFGIIMAAILSNMFMEDIYVEFVQFFKIESFPLDITENYYIYVIAYVFLLLSIYLAIYLFALGLKILFKGIMLGWLDRFLGAIFGFVKGVVLSSLFLAIIVFIGRFSSNVQVLVDKSEAINIVPDFSSFVFKVLPEDMRTAILDYKGE